MFVPRRTTGDGAATGDSTLLIEGVEHSEAESGAEVLDSQTEGTGSTFAPPSEEDLAGLSPQVAEVVRASGMRFARLDASEMPEGWVAGRLNVLERLEPKPIDVDTVRAAASKGSLVMGRADAVIEFGGTAGVLLEIEGNCAAFCPADEWDARLTFRFFSRWLHSEIRVKVLSYDEERGMAFVSRRQAQRDLANDLIPRIEQMLRDGVNPILPGRVVGISDNLIFVDIGGFVGIVPSGEVRVAPSQALKQIVNVGDQAEFAVISLKKDGDDPSQWSIVLGQRVINSPEWNRFLSIARSQDLVLVRVTEVVPNVDKTKKGYVWNLTGKTELPGGLAVDVLATAGPSRRIPIQVGSLYKAKIVYIDEGVQRVRAVLRDLVPEEWS